MSELAVIGGVYREWCRLPIKSDELWGSGGRAAAIVAGLGLKTTLHCPVDERSRAMLASLSEIFKFDVAEIPVRMSPEFHYVHGLSTPVIWPPVLPEVVEISVESENALVFGMLEAESKIRSKKIVYDPQNPISPKPIQLQTTPSKLAYVLNSSEAEQLVRENDPATAAQRVAKEFGASTVVIKQGPHGAWVFEEGRGQQVPAYRTESVWPIGSGDVFAAVFAARWAVQNYSAVDAASHASRASALYCDNRVIPITNRILEETDRFPFHALSVGRQPAGASEFHIYLAGPFFTMPQRWLVEESLNALRAMRLKVFSPLHEVGLGTADQVAPQDIEGLRQSRVVFALVDGMDPGTIFEIGFAKSLGKPIIAFSEAASEESLKMLVGTGCEIVSDFVSAIYRAAWAAQE